MRAIIIEDEEQAASRLVRLLDELEPGLSIEATLDTISASVSWLKTNHPPDLVFLDIQLADGVSFSIFDQVEMKSPIIFTTAYDAYALKAFKLNSVDYLLKPIDKDELSKALDKFKSNSAQSSLPGFSLANIQEAIRSLTRKFKTRFVIKVGEHLRTLETSAMVYFFSQDKATFAVTDDGRKHVLDYTLEQLESMLDPDEFFRISRKYIVSGKGIQDIITYSNSRLRLVLNKTDDKDIVVARERVQEFRNWLDR